jgi:hypothetical protein
MAKFIAAAREDQMFGLPALFRPTATWTLKLRKEDASFRGILYEDGASTPEDDGCPCYLVYGQKATIKLRCESIEVADRALTCLYGSSPEMTEQVHTREWAVVASIGGEIPEKHRLVQVDPIEDPDAYNVEIQKLAKASQVYDRGFERFVGKFDPSVPMAATMAIEKGCHGDYGVAILFQQEKRRCLHLGTILCAQSDEEAFWFKMMMWALFQPRSAAPRSEPGQLYYPASATHIVTKYWAYLGNPLRHPECNESEFTKNAMRYNAEALSYMNLSSYEPAVDADAPEKSLRIATQAALSRRKPIQDAHDCWNPTGHASEECGTVGAGSQTHAIVRN